MLTLLKPRPNREGYVLISVGLLLEFPIYINMFVSRFGCMFVFLSVCLPV